MVDPVDGGLCLRCLMVCSLGLGRLRCPYILDTRTSVTEGSSMTATATETASQPRSPLRYSRCSSAVVLVGEEASQTLTVYGKAALGTAVHITIRPRTFPSRMRIVRECMPPSSLALFCPSYPPFTGRGQVQGSLNLKYIKCAATPHALFSSAEHHPNAL